MKQPQKKTYTRITTQHLQKGASNICLVGRIISYNPKTSKLILQASDQPNITVQIVMAKVQKQHEGSLQKGAILEARGFGIDSRKMTCQEWNVFQGQLDLAMYGETVRLMSNQYRELFMGD